MPDPITAALITAVGVVLAALIQRVHWRLGRVSEKIDGLRNGTHRQALAALEELRREREELRLRGMPTRRRLDRMLDAEPDKP